MPTVPVLTMVVRVAGRRARYANAMDCARQIWHAEGVPGFYRGQVPSLMSLKRLLDESPWLQFTSECQRV